MSKCVIIWQNFCGPSTSDWPQNGAKMTWMDKLELRGMKHPAQNNKILSIWVKSLPYGVLPPPVCLGLRGDYATHWIVTKLTMNVMVKVTSNGYKAFSNVLSDLLITLWCIFIKVSHSNRLQLFPSSVPAPAQLDWVSFIPSSPPPRRTSTETW